MTTLSHFDVAVSLGSDRARLHLRGELDAAAVAILAERIEHVWSGGCDRSLILIDLTDLNYCDSSGVRVLLQIAARCAKDGVRFRIVGARRAVRRIFELTDTVDALNLSDND